jgi:hypothetical protein
MLPLAAYNMTRNESHVQPGALGACHSPACYPRQEGAAPLLRTCSIPIEPAPHASGTSPLARPATSMRRCSSAARRHQPSPTPSGRQRRAASGHCGPPPCAAHIKGNPKTLNPEVPIKCKAPRAARHQHTQAVTHHADGRSDPRYSLVRCMRTWMRRATPSQPRNSPARATGHRLQRMSKGRHACQADGQTYGP